MTLILSKLAAILLVAACMLGCPEDDSARVVDSAGTTDGGDTGDTGDTADTSDTGGTTGTIVPGESVDLDGSFRVKSSRYQLKGSTSPLNNKGAPAKTEAYELR
ncbi:MAG: hypothetical protein ACI9WU_005263 [Myxococcota bacterium]|jgi:hypothetical protein